MMQKNEYRRNENKRSFRTERKPVKNAGQDTYKVKSAQDAHKVKKHRKPGKIKKYEGKYVPGVQTLWWLSVPGHPI